VESVENSRNTAQVVGVGVGDKGHGELLHPPACQEGHNDPAAGVTPISSRSGIDQDPAAQGCSQHGTVTLTHVEKM
jgi:hypothetical protein